jgi:tetratricopeptide (TPR) repeat protein
LNLPVSAKRARIIALVIIGIFTLKSALRIPVYSNEFTYAKAGAEEAPQSPVFHELTGQLYLERNEPAAAVNAFNNAIALDSGNSSFYSNRAKAYYQLADFNRALKDDDKSILLDATVNETWLDRSRVRFELKDFPGAKADLEKAESLGATIPAEYKRVLENSQANPQK